MFTSRLLSQFKNFLHIFKWFVQTPELEDDNEQAVVQILDSFILISFCIALLVSGLVIIANQAVSTNSLISAVTAGIILGLRIPLKQGRVILVANILATLFIVPTTIMIYFFGTIHTVFTGTYLISIAISTFVLGKRMSLVYSGLAALGIVSLFCLEHFNKLPDPVTASTFNQCVVVLVLIILTAKIFQMENINRLRLQTSLKNAQSELVRREKVEEKLSYKSLHDDLTKLANRDLLKSNIDVSLQRLKDYPNRQFALLYLDLDRFKVINDSLGHDVGDQVLISFSDTLRSFLRDTDLAARLGGDEFVVLLNDITDTRDATTIANRILERLKEPIVVKGKSISIGTSIGIVSSYANYSRVDDMLRDADLAMYLSKENGKNQYTIFDDIIHQKTIHKLALENDFHSALRNEEFIIHYQPILKLADTSIAGLEALVRWQHPTKGFISPEVFIPIAEESGTINELSQYVMIRATKQFMLWKQNKTLPSEAYLSINIAPQCLGTPYYAQHLIAAIEAVDFDPRYLTLEITEGVLIDNLEFHIQVLQDLQTLGIRISIDDFGTGYSSLSYLHRLPLNNLKIDKSFVMGMNEDSKNRRIAESIVALGKSLDLHLIAEGIETAEQLDKLQKLECEFGQGYYFSKSLPVDKLSEYCRSLQGSYHPHLSDKDSSRISKYQ